MKRRSLLVLAGGAAAGVRAQDGEAEARLRQMQRARAGLPPQPLSPERARERQALLAQGEAALARVDVAAALAAFERAATMTHAADTEMGLVRCHMQSGEYRRALAFGAHTAGEHLDALGGTALYAWLLHAGAQPALAGQLLARAQERAPDQPLLAQVKAQLAAGCPRATAALLHAPVRLAPYATQQLAGSVVAGAALVGEGRMALAPAAVLPATARWAVRDGIGQTVGARVVGHVGPLAKLALERALDPASLASADADPFPGAVGFAAGYGHQPDAQPAWPQMRTGFVGAAVQGRGELALGIGLPAGIAPGGAVFDATGRLAGVIAPGPGSARLLGVGWLRQRAPALLPKSAPGATRLAPDAVYELALRTALQVVRLG